MHFTIHSLTLKFSAIPNNSLLVPAGSGGISSTQNPIEVTTLESINTTSSDVTVAATTVASTTIEITTTAPTVAPATTAIPESIALEAPSKKLPEPADISNGNEEIQHGDSEPIDASSPATKPPPVEEKLTQSQTIEGDMEEIAHAQAAEPEPMNLAPSAFPVDDIPPEITSHEPPSIEAER